jgi:hypothetical protein
MAEKEKRYPKGHFIGLGMALGAPLGIPLFLALDNPGMMGIGIAIGVAVGTALEGRYNRNPRPMTEEEIKTVKYATAAGVLALVAGVMVFLWFLLS